MKHMSEQLRASNREIDAYKERLRELDLDVQKLKEETIRVGKFKKVVTY